MIGIQFIPKKFREKQESKHLIVLNEQGLRLLKRACFDCHSYETQWPWYSYVAPISWLVERDVRMARARLNFSEWEDLGKSRKKKLAEKIIKSIETKSMPLWNYSLLHPEAKLEKSEQDIIFESLRIFLP